MKTLLKLLIVTLLITTAYSTTWSLYIKRYELSEWHLVGTYYSSLQCERIADWYNLQNIEAQCYPTED